MKNKLLALTLAFALFASLGLVAGAATPVSNSEPVLVAVGEDVESAHSLTRSDRCRRGNFTTRDGRWYITDLGVRRGYLYRGHQPRGIWRLIYGAHTDATYYRNC